MPASGLFQVLDESTLADLILPFDLFHGSSTIADLAWTLSGDLVFTAHGASSTMRFQSLNPAGSSGGIFVDAVTVRGPANPIPVPTTPSLLVAALAAVALTRRSLAARQSGA